MYATVMVRWMMLKVLLPFACAWAQRQEKLILRHGVPLTAGQLEEARRVGIKFPERVHLLKVDKMPIPLPILLRRLAERAGLVPRDTIGMTLRYGIFIRADCWGQRRLLVHELAHTAQYERMGGFVPFLRAYLHECLHPPGYPFGPLEQEAKRMEGELCGGETSP